MEDNTPNPPVPYRFSDPMTRGERIASLIYLPLHAAAIPLLLSVFMTVWPEAGLSDMKLNVFYYAFGCLYVFVFLMKYLRRGFDALIDNIRAFFVALFVAYAVYFALSMAVELAAMAFGFDITATPNNEFVLDMADQNFNLIFAMTVFMAPLVEEPLFRGAIFGSLYKANKYAAYAVSAVLFSLYHVWQFAVAYQDPTYLLYALQYIPPSIALAYCYERTGSIWTPIFFHMAVNGLSMFLAASA